MLHILKHLRLSVLLGCMLLATTLQAVTENELLELEAEMLKYMDSKDHEAFYQISNHLKEASKEAGNERLLFKAWSYQSLYEATQMSYQRAHDIAQEMMEYARGEGSIYGEYSAMHAEAMVLMQQQDFAAAERAFLEAVDFHRRRFPSESVGDDLRELIKIAYLTNNRERAKSYANQMLAEPNLAPHHKGRTLSRLSLMAFEENNVEEFNRIYEEMERLTKTDGIKSIDLYTEVNYYIINGDFKQALLLADRLSADSCAERKAIIYHRLGDNEKAYDFMVEYKRLSDSITHASHNSTVASMYLRMNNDRLRLEQELLANQNNQLRYRFYIAVGVLLILVLLFVIYKRRKIIKLLRRDNSILDSSKKGAERALKDLNELSSYESLSTLSLTTPTNLNLLCNHLASITQKHCNKGVITVFQTDFPDDFEIKTNPDALEKLLTHLLDCSTRFTRKGSIKLRCAESGEFVRLSITDTSHILDNKSLGFFVDDDDSTRYVSTNFNICQSICRLLYGRIWNDPKYTDGTRINLEIQVEPK